MPKTKLQSHCKKNAYVWVSQSNFIDQKTQFSFLLMMTEAYLCYTFSIPICENWSAFLVPQLSLVFTMELDRTLTITLVYDIERFITLSF